MVLPDKTVISASKYIQEIVFPMIPVDGYFTLVNGQKIPYKQYIEEFVMYEGQTKYCGDFGKLLLATTKNNNGQIKFNEEDMKVVLR